jgi:hypothetical protein
MIIAMKTTFYSLLIVFITLLMFSCEKSQQLTLTGKYLSHSVCKRGLIPASTRLNTSDSLSCVEFSFDNLNNKLIIKHVNAGFNCCQDSIYCDISLDGDTIKIVESDQNPRCKCECLYDLDFEINGVTTKKYLIALIEPNVGDQDNINFEMDLAKDKEGSYCVTRKGYPWGQ